MVDFIKMSKIWFLSMEFYGAWQDDYIMRPAPGDTERRLHANFDDNRSAYLSLFGIMFE